MMSVKEAATLPEDATAPEPARVIEMPSALPPTIELNAQERLHHGSAFRLETCDLRLAGHAVFPCSAWPASRRMPPRFSPSWAAKNSPSSSDGPIENRCSTIAAPTAASSGAP